MYCSKCSLRNPIQSLIFWNAIFNDIQILCLGFLWFHYTILIDKTICTIYFPFLVLYCNYSLGDKGADCMTNLSSDSWTNLLKNTFVITWRELQQFPARFVKPRVIAFKFHPGLYELGHAHGTSCECKKLPCRRFPPNFVHFARAEICHVIARKFHPGGRTEISTRAEIRHVIGP